MYLLVRPVAIMAVGKVARLNLLGPKVLVKRQSGSGEGRGKRCRVESRLHWLAGGLRRDQHELHPPRGLLWNEGLGVKVIEDRTFPIFSV